MYTINYKINGVKKSFESENLIDEIVERKGKYYYPITDTQNDNFKNLIKLLKKWIKISKFLDIEWWACAGTLLGALRNESFIPWDDDIDLCFLYKDYKKISDFANNETINKKGVVIEKSSIGFRMKFKDSSSF